MLKILSYKENGHSGLGVILKLAMQFFDYFLAVFQMTVDNERFLWNHIFGKSVRSGWKVCLLYET